ncbi:unnamed protein product [Rotaria socialis]|uniref:Uncharacterized protein n=1 Tax=Rotaria socialis TaxID=392032 RepID=A0A817VNT4_9BILA|nr:unnamed protein product [Rotaria socialis]CAF4692697.1 unnamed protein product [Rotaria socialis]
MKSPEYYGTGRFRAGLFDLGEAYYEVIDMLNDLEILDLLKDKRTLDLKLLSEYVFKQLNSNSKMYDYSPQLIDSDDEEFEIADDDDDDDDNNEETTSDLNMDDDNDDDYSDEDEQDAPRDSIDTRKEAFSGMKIFSTVQSDVEHSYFKVKINDGTQYIHKQTACWLLTGEKSKISNNRLLRVQQTNKKN